MTPGKTILQYLNDSCVKQEGKTKSFSHKLEDLTFRLEVKDFDKFSFMIGTLQVERFRDVDSNALVEQTEFLKKHLTYLLENIETFELDEPNLKALLRSNIPHKDESSLSYFEIIIEGGKKISLERVVFHKEGKQRESVPFHVTTEVLERTIDDFVKALQID